MNYLDSYEYKEMKDQLIDEYKETFKLIEGFYIAANTKESYEIQITLSQILDDFLLAQKDNKPVSKLTGNDVRKYAIKMLQAETDREKKGLYWLHTSMLLVWFVMISTLILNISYKTGAASLTEKLSYIHIGFNEILLFSIACIMGFIQMRLKYILFYKQKYIKQLSLITLLPTAMFVTFINNFKSTAKNNFIFSIPGLLYFGICIPLTIYVVILCIISYKKTRAKKILLLDKHFDDITPEQISCPSCNKEIDYDHIKCPYCGYKILK